MSEHKESFGAKINASALLTIIGIILLFSGAVLITLIAPRYVDKAWTEPSSYYQVQMYEVADPRIYFSGASAVSKRLEYVHHLIEGESLLAFMETSLVRIVAPEHLERYITRYGEKSLKLTPKVFLLREPEGEMRDKGESLRERLQGGDSSPKIDYQIVELYDPDAKEVFVITDTDGVSEDFVSENFEIVDQEITRPYMNDPGVVYIKNPSEYRISLFQRGGAFGWRYDQSGDPITSLAQLKSEPLGFRSRRELIEHGEHIFAIEGCWYCHTDQTRTLVQDVVLNGTESYPAPPSSPNEYIYNQITFPGTRRIGLDLSRVGRKRPNRDWHISHFWQPRTESPGSIMPSFRHFFDFDPSGTAKTEISVPNYQFEAVFQYLMTKGTRITPPTQAWWLGLDPVHTLEIIEGKK